MRSLLAILSVLLLTDVVCASLRRRGQNQGGSLSGSGGETLRNKPIDSQKTTDGRRGMESNDEGDLEFEDNNGKELKIGVRRLVELDVNKTELLHSLAKIDFDGKNPQNRNITRESVTADEINNAPVDFGSKFRMGRQSNEVVQTGSMRGTGQKNRLGAPGGTKCDIEGIMKTDDSTMTIQIGNSSTSVQKDDMKVTLTIMDHVFCGYGKSCILQGGIEEFGEYLRIYLSFQSDSDSSSGGGGQSRSRPSRSPNNARRRPANNTNDEEFTAGGDSNMVIRMLRNQLADNGTDLISNFIDVEPALWTEFNGVQVSGFFIDLQRVPGDNVTYTYDPTVFLDTSSSTGHSNTFRISFVGLCLSIVLSYLMYM